MQEIEVKQGEVVITWLNMITMHMDLGAVIY